MSTVMRLSSISLAGGEEVAVDGPATLFVAAGSERTDTEHAADTGAVFIEGARITAGKGGATLWLTRLLDPGTPQRGRLMLEAPLAAEALTGRCLLRLDGVAFPPGGTALLHVHHGPGIRCLVEGTIRIDTDGHSTAYGPGSAWFEAGPEAVFAQTDAVRPSRFVRTMVLPASFTGRSSIRYVRPEDVDRPKSQSYTSYAEALLPD